MRCWYVALLCLSYEGVEDLRDARFALIQFMREALTDCQLVQLQGLCALRGRKRPYSRRIRVASRAAITGGRHVCWRPPVSAALVTDSQT